MFICAICKTQQPPCAKQFKVAVETRDVVYDVVKNNAGPPLSVRESLPNDVVLFSTDGKEIVREVAACHGCSVGAYQI